MHPAVKLSTEFGPLVLFFLSQRYLGIIEATGLLVLAALCSLGISYMITKRISPLLAVGTIFLVIFGALTYFLQDETFIKVKVTLIYCVFGGGLLGSLFAKKPLLSHVLELGFDLEPWAWRSLTLRWSLFFFLLAALNECIWRTQTTEMWVMFKVFGTLLLTFLFILTQIPLIRKARVRNISRL